MGGGKSYILRWAAIIHLLYLFAKTHMYGIPVGLFSENYPTLKDRQVSRIEREFPSWLGELKDDKVDGLCFKIAHEYGEGKILLRNLDDPSKYMSTEFAGEFVEELTRNPYQTFEDLRNRLRYPGIDEVKFMGATNPGGVGHGWVKKYFIDKNSGDHEQERFFYVHANAYDNNFISPEYIKQLESLPERQKKAYLEGSWDIFAGQYFTEWNPNLHIIEPFIPKSGSVIVGGMDWGRANPFSFHLASIDRVYFRNEDNEIINFFRAKTFFETYGIEKNPSDWAEIIEDHLYKRYKLTLGDISWIKADPVMLGKQTDGSESIKDQFYKVNDDWRIIEGGSNDRIPGWTAMHKWLSIAPDGKPYWQVTSNCTNLIRTVPEVVHEEPPHNVEDVDTKGEDHAVDDARYMLKNLNFIDGFTGQIKTHKYDEAPDGNKGKFWGSNENMNDHIIDINKFR